MFYSVIKLDVTIPTRTVPYWIIKHIFESVAKMFLVLRDKTVGSLEVDQALAGLGLSFKI